MIPAQRPSHSAYMAPQNRLLLDTVDRLSRIRAGRVAVHLHLSRLAQINRRPGTLRIATHMLTPMVSTYSGQIFCLSNGDVIFVVNQPSRAVLETHLHSLRSLFSREPLDQDTEADGRVPFYTTYDLGVEYESFRLAALAAAGDTGPKQAAPFRPLNAENLDELLRRLDQLDITPFVRRQSAVELDKKMVLKVVFQEFFISLSDLQKELAPNLDLLSNRWLFQHLTVQLDRKLLKAVLAMGLSRAPPVTHLNLNLDSLNDPAFLEFARGNARGNYIGVEVTPLDVFAAGNRFPGIRAGMIGRGFRLVVDGLDEATLSIVDVPRLEADLYKMQWNSEMLEGGRGERMLELLRPFDPGHVVLARCDSEASLHWGLAAGIRKFQGRYVERLLGMASVGACDQAARLSCSVAQCAARRASIAPSIRLECGNNALLDQPPMIRAPSTSG